MAGGVELDRGTDQPGGIASLSHLLREHGEAVRFDLIQAGLSLDDLGVDLSWIDLRAVVRHTPRATSALQRELHGDIVDWDVTAQLTAAALDTLRGANWQRSGGKGPRPRPIPRPQDKAEKRLTTADLRRDRMQSGVIGTPMRQRDMRRWLEGINGRR